MEHFEDEAFCLQTVLGLRNRPHWSRRLLNVTQTYRSKLFSCNYMVNKLGVRMLPGV